LHAKEKFKQVRRNKGHVVKRYHFTKKAVHQLRKNGFLACPDNYRSRQPNQGWAQYKTCKEWTHSGCAKRIS
jgi:hypothetical protein